MLNIFWKMPQIHDSQFFSCSRTISSSIWWQHKLQAALIIQFLPAQPAPSLSSYAEHPPTRSKDCDCGSRFCRQAQGILFSLASRDGCWLPHPLKISPEKSLVFSKLWSLINFFFLLYKLYRGVKNICIWFYYFFWKQRKKHTLGRNEMGHWKYLTSSKKARFSSWFRQEYNQGTGLTLPM